MSTAKKTTPKNPAVKNSGSVERCEVCAARVGDDRPRRDRRRCAEHVDQQVLFPLSAVGARRPTPWAPRRRARPSSFSRES